MHKKSPSKIWRKFQNRYSLIGSKSKSTGKVYYPPVNFDPNTGESEFEIYKFKKEAKLVTWSQVSTPPSGYEFNKPYIIAILELENGQRLTSQLVDVDYETLKKGMILKPVFRKYFEDGKDGVIHYGLKFTK